MKSENNSTQPEQLERSLGPLMLWGLGVGYVISGMYFGWNLGLAEGGTFGLAIATFFIATMYVTFTLSYTEMACAMPRAGGAFTYTNKAFGEKWGFLAGMCQLMEFLFAPPAIAAAIGAYFNLFFPSIPILTIAIAAYGVFTALNIWGVKVAASFELWVTIFAVVELLIFAGMSLPHFEWSNLTRNSLPNGWMGVFAAIPFAIWFFLAIEGIANVAEETINPQRNVVIGFGSAMFTLVVLCILTFTSAVGVNGWESIVFPYDGAVPSDSPLPLALSHIVGQNHFMYHLLITIGLFGLVASFHGIILIGGRATFSFGRKGCAPKFLGEVHPRLKTPAAALIVNMGIGVLALLTGKTGEIIILSAFGAISLYIISMISLFKLRRFHADMDRPFTVPLYPYTPIVALSIATIALISMVIYHPFLTLIYFGILGISFLGFLMYAKPEEQPVLNAKRTCGL